MESFVLNKALFGLRKLPSAFLFPKIIKNKTAKGLNWLARCVRKKKTKQNKEQVSQRTVSVLQTLNFNSSGFSLIVPETVRIR